MKIITFLNNLGLGCTEKSDAARMRKIFFTCLQSVAARRGESGAAR